MNARLWMSPFSFLSISHLFCQPLAILVTLNLNIPTELFFTDFQKSSFFYCSTWCSQYSANSFFFCLVEKSLLTVIDSSMNTKNSRENTADIKFQSKVECYQNGYRLSKEVRNWRKTKRWHSQSSIHNWENSICEKLLQSHSCTGQDWRICVRRSSMVSNLYVE